MWQARMMGAVLTVWPWFVPGGREVRARVCGDADGSGVVTVIDGVQALRAVAGLSISRAAGRCDVDGNGSITVTDGVNVLRKAADVDVEFDDGHFDAFTYNLDTDELTPMSLASVGDRVLAREREEAYLPGRQRPV